jgi:hypothetical protein
MILYCRDNIGLAVQQSQTQNVELEDSELNYTLSELLDNLKAANKVSDKDSKANCLNLRCYIYPVCEPVRIHFLY